MKTLAVINLGLDLRLATCLLLTLTICLVAPIITVYVPIASTLSFGPASKFLRLIFCQSQKHLKRNWYAAAGNATKVFICIQIEWVLAAFYTWSRVKFCLQNLS